MQLFFTSFTTALFFSLPVFSVPVDTALESPNFTALLGLVSRASAPDTQLITSHVSARDATIIPGEFSKRSEEESQQPHPRDLDGAHAQGRVKLCAHKLLVGCAEFNVEYGKCVEMYTTGVPGNKQMKSYGVLKRWCGFFSEPGCDDNPKGYMFMAENRWDGELGPRDNDKLQSFKCLAECRWNWR